MIDFLDREASDTRFLAMVFAAVGAAATVLTLAMPLLATDTLARRMKSVALEREKIRQRERERLAARREGRAAPLAEAVHADDRRAVQSEQVGRPGGGARAAGPGRLPRPGALRHLSVLPHGDAGRHAGRSRLFYVFVVIELDQPRDGQARLICISRGVFRHARAGAVREEQDHAAPAVDQARLSRRARPAADLRRIRHVDRGGVPQGVARRSARNRSRWPRS